MKLIKPSYIIFNKEDIKRAEKEIELAARTCYKSEDKITDESAEKLITKLIDSHHDAMLEFGPSITVKFICDRGVSHELVRHRLCSFAQESTRYCNYSKDKHDNQITFIEPLWLNDIPEKWHEFGDHQMERIDSAANYKEFLLMAEETYMELIKEGWSPQQARSVLPNSLKTEIVVKANIREWRHIFMQRTDNGAHPQMKELMIPLLKEFADESPILFKDLLQ